MQTKKGRPKGAGSAAILMREEGRRPGKIVVEVAPAALPTPGGPGCISKETRGVAPQDPAGPLRSEIGPVLCATTGVAQKEVRTMKVTEGPACRLVIPAPKAGAAIDIGHCESRGWLRSDPGACGSDRAGPSPAARFMRGLATQVFSPEARTRRRPVWSYRPSPHPSRSSCRATCPGPGPDRPGRYWLRAT